MEKLLVLVWFSWTYISWPRFPWSSRTQM